jgi:hypothetical protein
MGTNYYWHEKPECSHCGREFEGVHIGKSSGGWCFSLHVYPNDNINDWPDWKERLCQPGSHIRNEYGERVTLEEMVAIVTKRAWKSPGTRDVQYLTSNHAAEGPYGLMRHAIGHGTIAHGEGTWDLLDCDFS